MSTGGYNINAEAYAAKMGGAKPSVVTIAHDPFKVVSDGDLETLIKLLDNAEDPVNVNKIRWSGFSLLHRACSQGHTDLVQVLVENGAKINQRSIWGWHTPLHLALSNGWEETSRYLVSAGADIHAVNKEKETACEYAIKRGRYS